MVNKRKRYTLGLVSRQMLFTGLLNTTNCQGPSVKFNRVMRLRVRWLPGHHPTSSLNQNKHCDVLLMQRVH